MSKASRRATKERRNEVVERAIDEALAAAAEEEEKKPRVRDLGNGVAITESGLVVPSHVGH